MEVVGADESLPFLEKPKTTSIISYQACGTTLLLFFI